TPLGSQECIERSAMVAQLFSQLGISTRSVVHPDPRIILAPAQHTYNVFYIRHAETSPYIVDQDAFVKRFGVRSVIGFGGSFPSGEHFVIVGFSRAEIPPEAADMFRYLALNAKLALLPFDGEPCFTDQSLAPQAPDRHQSEGVASLHAQGAASAQLLHVYEMLAADQVERFRTLSRLTGELSFALDVDAALAVFGVGVVPRVADGFM